MIDPVQIGRYKILGRLGHGAMGVVYRAVDPTLDREVALKVMAAGRGADTASRERFAREGRAAARLQHPNIITIYELGEHDGAPFMALELLEGVDLQRAIEAGLRPNPKVTFPIVLQLLAGLGHAHESGIVHRDVKPSNVFLPKNRPAKIMDFGVARLGGGATSTGVVGTPNYMSPEQVKGTPLDGRSDLFSAGLILYELVTGEKAYQADTVVSLLYKIAIESPDLGLIPKGAQWSRLRGVLDRSLAKEADARYPDAAAMAAELTLALQDLGGVADWTQAASHGIMPTAQRAQAMATIVEPLPLPLQWEEPAADPLPPPPPRASHAIPIAIAGLAALIFAGIGVALFWPAKSVTPPRATPPPQLATPAPSMPATMAPATVAPAPLPRPAISPEPTSLPPPSIAPVVTRPPATVATAPPQTLSPSARPTPTPRDTASADARLERANDYMEKQNFQAALSEARTVLAREPGNAAAKAMVEDAEAGLVVETRLKNARAALKKGDHETAMSEVKAGLSVNPSDSRLIELFRQLRAAE